MPALLSTIKRRFNSRHITTLLCLLLLILGSTLQVTHAHASGESHADCSLCVTAHSATIVAVPQIALVPPAAFAEATPQAPPEPQVRLFRDHPLSIRPPPVAAVLA